MAYRQITPPYGDINQLPAVQYRGHLEELQGVLRLVDAMLVELYAGIGAGAAVGGVLVSSTPGAGAITGYAPTGFGSLTDRLDVVSDAADTTLNDLTAGYDGQKVRVRNIGTGTLTLTNANSGSTAANRFSGVVSVGIVAGDCTEIVYYGGSINRWVM